MRTRDFFQDKCPRPMTNGGTVMPQRVLHLEQDLGEAVMSGKVHARREHSPEGAAADGTPIPLVSMWETG